MKESPPDLAAESPREQGTTHPFGQKIVPGVVKCLLRKRGKRR